VQLACDFSASNGTSALKSNLENHTSLYIRCHRSGEQDLINTSRKMGEWNGSHQNAFVHQMTLLQTAPRLSFALPEGRFILDTDASGTAVAAELSQIQVGMEGTMAYASNTLVPAQRNYCPTRKELLAVIRFTRQFRQFLLGRTFTLRTDQGSLVWHMRFKNPEGQIARWLEELAQYDMEIEHRPGGKQRNADTLSRIPDTLLSCDCYCAVEFLESLPCGGCA
jgi:hypothetical protein